MRQQPSATEVRLPATDLSATGAPTSNMARRVTMRVLDDPIMQLRQQNIVLATGPSDPPRGPSVVRLRDMTYTPALILSTPRAIDAFRRSGYTRLLASTPVLAISE